MHWISQNDLTYFFVWLNRNYKSIKIAVHTNTHTHTHTNKKNKKQKMKKKQNKKSGGAIASPAPPAVPPLK